MTFGIYLAGCWNDRTNIREHYQKDLLKKISGAVITHDWTNTEEDGFDQRTTSDNDRYAQLDLWEGVGKADCVVAIKTVKDYAYRGTGQEIGFALGRGIPVYILAHDDPDSYVYKNVFHHLTRGQRTFDDWDTLVSTVQEQAQVEEHYRQDQGKNLRQMLKEET